MKNLKVYVTKNPFQAQMKVFFVKRIQDEIASELIAQADRVAYPTQADVLVYITHNKAEAHIAILPDRMPRMKKSIPRY